MHRSLGNLGHQLYSTEAILEGATRTVAWIHPKLSKAHLKLEVNNAQNQPRSTAFKGPNYSWKNIKAEPP